MHSVQMKPRQIKNFIQYVMWLCVLQIVKGTVRFIKISTSSNKIFLHNLKKTVMMSYISEETRVFLLTRKPKLAEVRGAVNKLLSAKGRKPYVRNTGPETGSNINVNLELNPSTGN